MKQNYRQSFLLVCAWETPWTWPSTKSTFHNTNCYIKQGIVSTIHTKPFYLSLHSKWRKPQTLHIYSDSMSSLASLQDPSSAENKHLTCSILETFHKLSYKIHLHWIPGHQGHKGNKTADILAKSATVSNLMAIVCLKTYTSYQKIKLQLKDQLLAKLKSYWNEIVTERPAITEFLSHMTKLNFKNT
jgi:RNase H